MPVTFW